MRASFWRMLVLVAGVATLALPGPIRGESRFLVVFKGATGDAAAMSRAIEAAGGTVAAVHPSIGLAVASAEDPDFQTILGRDRSVESVGPDLTIQGQSFGESIVEVQEAATSASSLIDPSGATALGLQWNLHRIQAPQAWAAGHTGDPNVVVAIVDSGVDYTHRELVGRIDLARSISLRPDDDAVVQQHFPGALPIADLHGHGTHIASLIACNAVSTACVAPNVTLVAVKALDRLNLGPVSAMIAGILYAADIEADIINLSFIVLHFETNNPEFRGAVAAFNRAINYATRKGALVLADAGAAGIDLDGSGESIYPAQSGNALAITGTDRDDGLANITANWGSSLVDLAAPGGVRGTSSPITNAVLGACSSFSITLFPNCQRPTSQSPFRYAVLAGQGTYVAQTAGVAALIDSKVGGAYNAAQLKTILIRSADDLGKVGTDEFFGKGRINAFRAVTE